MNTPPPPLPAVLVPAGESPDIAHMKRADGPAIWERYREELEKFRTDAATLTVTAASQTLEMRRAREVRLILKKLRCDIENRRKELVDDAVKTQRDVNACARWLKEQIEPLEARLQYQEDFVKREEELRLTNLRHAREAELAPLAADVTAFADLGALPDDTYARILADAQAAHAARLEQAARFDAERIERETREARERELLRTENARLEKEAAENRRQQQEREAKAREEQAAVERKLHYERERAQRAENEARALREAEAAEAERIAEEARRAATAPDRDKLTALATTIRGLLPQLSTAAGKASLPVINVALEQCAETVEGVADGL